MSNKKYVIGLFDDEDILKSGINAVKKEGVSIYDVYTPYPVHGLENLLDIPRSRLPIVAFLFGCLGFCVAFSMQYYMMAYDWKMDIGGKPFFPMPSFIPVCFEWTVLFAALGMTATFMYVNHMAPGRRARIMDERGTDDRFVMAIEVTGKSEDKINQLLKKAGAVEIKVKEA